MSFYQKSKYISMPFAVQILLIRQLIAMEQIVTVKVLQIQEQIQAQPAKLDLNEKSLPKQ